MKIGTCRGCNARVMMARHKDTGRKAPIEVDPSDDGNISVVGDRYEIVPEELREKYKARGYKLRKNHFATCQFAKTFAKKVKARRELKRRAAAQS